MNAGQRATRLASAGGGPDDVNDDGICHDDPFVVHVVVRDNVSLGEAGRPLSLVA